MAVRWSGAPWPFKVTTLRAVKSGISRGEPGLTPLRHRRQGLTGWDESIGWLEAAVWRTTSGANGMRDEVIISEVDLDAETHHPRSCASLFRLRSPPPPRLRVHCRGSHCGGREERGGATCKSSGGGGGHSRGRVKQSTQTNPSLSLFSSFFLSFFLFCFFLKPEVKLKTQRPLVLPLTQSNPVLALQLAGTRGESSNNGHSIPGRDVLSELVPRSSFFFFFLTRPYWH